MRLWSVVVTQPRMPGGPPLRCSGGSGDDLGTFVEDRHDGRAPPLRQPRRRTASPGTACTVKRIAGGRARRTPSTRRPTRPASVMLTSMALSTPGIRSRFSMKWGTQNEWMTSADDELEPHRLGRPAARAPGPCPGTPVTVTRRALVAELPLPLEPDHPHGEVRVVPTWR